MDSPRLPTWVLVASLAVLARAAAAQEEPFEPTGEIRFRVSGGITTSASFNATRVVGPVVNMTRREDGTWAGDLLGENLDLHVDPAEEGKEQKASGSFFTLVQRAGKDSVVAEGLFNGVRFRAEVGPKKVKARFGNCSLDAVKKGTVYRGDLGCLYPGASLPTTGRAVMEFMGEAADRAPFPQLALALLAVLPQ
jgi:hypothetical protein